MSKTIKSAEINFKNNAGNYVGVNSVSERKTSEQIADIEDAASTQMSNIQAKGQAVRDLVPADYEDLVNSIAEAYDNTKTYAVGDYVFHTTGTSPNEETKLYRCVSQITTAESWTAVHWTEVKLGNDVNDLKSALTELSEYTYKDILQTQSVDVTAGQAVNPNTKIPFSVPSNTQFTLKFSFASGMFTDNKIVAIYAYDNNNSKTAIKYNAVIDTEYTFTLNYNVSGIGLYTLAPDVLSSGTVYILVKYSNPNQNAIGYKMDSLEKISSKFIKTDVDASDCELGALENGTGKEIANYTGNRVRTKYLPMRAGSVITITGHTFNAWEFSLIDKSCIANTEGWKTSYTVINDCYLRLMWNAGNAPYATIEELLAETSIPSIYVLSPVAYDYDTIESRFKNDNPDLTHLLSYESVTVKTIAHRGDDKSAPQCTAPAYIMARSHGITIMENDLWKSQDGVYVMWHDSNLGRLGYLVDINGYDMYTDGTDFYYVKNNSVFTFENNQYVSAAVSLESLTKCNGASYGVNTTGMGGVVYNVIGLSFDVLRRIDFGVYKGQQFAGTQILTFEEWVLLCKQLGAEIYVDTKMTMTNSVINDVAHIVKNLGMGKYSSWLSIPLTEGVPYLRSIIPDARVGVLDHPDGSRIENYAPYNTGRGLFFNGNGKNMPTKETIQSAIDAGYEVEVWIVEYGALTEEQVFEYIRTAVSYGVTGITCDHYRVADAFSYLYA